MQPENPNNVQKQGSNAENDNSRVSEKPATTYTEQIQILKNRGLLIKDESFAHHCLMHYNYYRLSAYRFPLTIPGNPDQFQPDTTFEDLWRLYRFDRTLRRLILDACKRIEISVRSRWAYVLAHRHGPQAYEREAIFKDPAQHGEILRKLDEELARSDEDFIKHFKKKYGIVRPPIWAVCEVISFGQLSKYFENLKNPADRQAIADTYGLDEKVLDSFLHHLSTVRNHAAHHGRMWNRKFALKFQQPRKKPKDLSASFVPDVPASHGNERKIYNTLIMLLYLQNRIDPNAGWQDQLIQELQALEERFLPHMGFPPDWKDRPIWYNYFLKAEAGLEAESQGQKVNDLKPKSNPPGALH